MAELGAAGEAIGGGGFLSRPAQAAPVEQTEMIEPGRPWLTFERPDQQLARAFPIAAFEGIDAAVEFGARAEHAS
jgi:hypothetical protein